MFSGRFPPAAALALAACVLASVLMPAAAADSEHREAVVAGGPGHFMEVRHVFIRGMNYAIGKELGRIAAAFGARPTTQGDRLLNKVQREYMARNHPILYERMRGIAEAFGLSLADDRFDFSSILLFPAGSAHCSAVFYPGTHTASGHGIMSRNYDFTTGTIAGRLPKGDEAPVMSRPLIIELHPDKGYASLALCAFDLMGGVLDGINEKGLAVAIFGDDDTMMRHGMHPTNGIGLNELMSMRWLLDTCENAGEAKEALLIAKHFYTFVPCHYLIADRSSESFIFEFSPYRQHTHIVEGEGPQCVTNHLVSQYPQTEDFPDSVMIDTFDRYRTLHAAIAGKDDFTSDEITAINTAVAKTAAASGHPDNAPGRTLWHAIYDTTDLSLRVKFYLGDRPDPAGGGAKIAEYSDYIELSLRSP